MKQYGNGPLGRLIRPVSEKNPAKQGLKRQVGDALVVKAVESQRRIQQNKD